jgi:ABC-type polysaccharide/polyol phosphate export permease
LTSSISARAEDEGSLATVDGLPGAAAETVSAAEVPLEGPEISDRPVDATLRPTPPSQSQLVVLDIVEGALAWRLWGSLGWQDIRQRYRRSTIGPFWVTLSMGAMIGGMGVLYADLFHTDVHTYLPYLTVGVILWGLISPLVIENCNAFIDGEGIIKQVKVPLSLYVYRVVWRNLIIFGHNVVIFVIVAVLFKVWPHWSSLLAIPALLLICINGVWIGLLWGPISARFRDVPQTITSVMQIAFFMTPIMWQPSAISGREWFLELNPFYYFIALVRGSLLGNESPSMHLWRWALAITAAGWIVTFFLYRRCRWRIAYWL